MSPGHLARRLGAVALLCACWSVVQATDVANATVAGATPPQGSLQQILMGHALILRGVVDGRQVQLSLQPKKDEDGLEGRYFYFGDSPQILVAGEVEGDDLVMEESLDGRNVSGQWIGHRQGAAIVGTWSSVDGAINKPFSLQLP